MNLIKTTGALGAVAFVAGLTMAMGDGNKDTTTKTERVAGVVTGKIVFDGKKPEVKPLKISAEQSKGCCPPDVSMNMTDRSLLIDDKGGIANVVVTLNVEGEKLEVPEAKIALDQKLCRFEPHVTVIPVGATIEFLNSDEVSHNIHTYAAKNEGENRTVGPGGTLDYKLAKGEAVKIQCDVHPWMLGWAYVTEDNRATVTSTSGEFKIENVPAGEYKINIWHEKLGKGKATVIVAEDGSSKPVEVKLGGKKKGAGRRRR